MAACFRYMLIAAMAVAVSSARPVRADEAPAKGATEEGKVKKSELHQHMEKMEEAIKKLRRTIRKAESTPESIELTATVKKEATTCRDLIPSRAATLPEAERTKFVEQYKKSMDAFIAQVGKLDEALHAGDLEKAGDAYKDLKSKEDKGHDEFMQPDEAEKAKK